ncbi:MAG: electron transfer flavoprotein subunit alpha/FixB family protein [Cyanobacteria bacterium SIG30]|nr:electron transfer flavoprotein subunit alpha/FixB family protein [Cyanobacteria bacterium SIG30]
MNNEIFVYIEKINNKVRDVSLELLNNARNLNGKVCAILCSEKEENDFQILYENGADKVYNLIDKKLNIYNSLYFSDAIIKLVKEKEPKIILVGATKIGRDLAPKISSSLNTGLTADCTKLEIVNYKDEEKLASTRPTFGGSLMATILCKNYPQMATVRENVIKKADKIYKENGELENFYPNIEKESKIQIIEFIEDVKKNTDNLANAQIVLAGGLGLKNKENFEKLEKIASLFGTNCAVGATRGAVDKGYASKDKQIGQTGKTIAPKIYVAFGISGAIQHMVGIENSDYIIAINNDENAQIFENCDLKIVEDAQTVIDSLLDNMHNI